MATHSLNDVTLVVDGNNITDLLPEGVVITFDNDIFEHVPGVNSSTRRRNVDESGTVEINVMRTSTQNGVLNAIIDEDMLTNNKRFGFSCVDNINGEAYSGVNCYFTRRADGSFTEDGVGRVYTIKVPKLKIDKSVVAE